MTIKIPINLNGLPGLEGGLLITIETDMVFNQGPIGEYMGIEKADTDEMKEWAENASGKEVRDFMQWYSNQDETPDWLKTWDRQWLTCMAHTIPEVKDNDDISLCGDSEEAAARAHGLTTITVENRQYPNTPLCEDCFDEVNRVYAP